jgi:2-polyprenyl-3-methyl-5-hydroxy-6-metoxy-1,4-benzoquinol methylase
VNSGASEGLEVPAPYVFFSTSIYLISKSKIQYFLFVWLPAYIFNEMKWKTRHTYQVCKLHEIYTKMSTCEFKLQNDLKLQQIINIIWHEIYVYKNKSLLGNKLTYCSKNSLTKPKGYQKT